MNSIPSRRGSRGFTLVELLVVIAIIGILAALLLPVLNQGRARGQQAFCENNLKEMAIAFHSFGHDHNSQFPMAVSTNENGAKEFVDNGYQAGGIFYFGFHVFQTVSNELVRPQLLICPSDLSRVAASNFPDLQNRNISYFFSANADFLNANSPLAGDRDLATNSVLQPTILQLGGGSWLRWTREVHQFKGNVLFADGHVEEWNAAKLKSANNNLSPAANLFMPSVSPTNPVNSGGGNSNGGSGGSYGGGSGSSGGGGGNRMNNSASPPSSGGNGNQNNSRSAVPPFVFANNQPNSKTNSNSGKPAPMSPPTASANNGGMNRNFGRGSSQELFTNQAASLAQNAQSNPIIAADDLQPEMSPTDQKIARILRGTFEWGYFLLLLLLLLFLIYKLWQILRRDEKRRRANEDELPPQS